MSDSKTIGINSNTQPIFSLCLQNKQDREAAAMALFRAGYAVREIKRKENGKSITFLEYWR